MNLLRTLRADATGATSIEYAFIASMISLAALVGVQSLGAEVTNSYSDTAAKIAAAND